MASTDNGCSRQRTTIVGRRTWLFTGTSLVAMGTVVIAAGIALQQQLHRSKCHVSFDSNSQSMNAKNGIWFGIPIVLYGLLTISAGICRRKALMMMLAILSVSFILLNLKHLLLTEVSIMSNCSNHNSDYSSQGRGNETNGGGGGERQAKATEDDRLSLRFSPEDRIIALERVLHMRGDHDTRLDWNSNSNNEQSMKYQHQPGANGGAKSEGAWPEGTEERDHDMDQDLLNQTFSGGTAVKFGENRLSSADVSSNDATGNKVTTTLTSESIETEDDDSSYESSGSGKGLDDDEDYDDDDDDEKVEDNDDKMKDEDEDGFEVVGKEPERNEYDSELKDIEGSKTAEEEPFSAFWERRKRELGGRRGREEEDCVEEDGINLQWLIRLMHCLMAVVRFIVLVLSIVMATLLLAPCCCYQKDEMEDSAKKFSGIQSVTPVAATEKDDASQRSDDATLLQV